MKFVRYGEPGNERPGLWLNNVEGFEGPAILDIRGMAFDMFDINALFLTRCGMERAALLLKESKPKFISAKNVRLGPPIARPGQIICIGKNYADHAAEFDSEILEEPILFAKAPSSLNGPFDPIILPAGCTTGDIEAELGIVIGRQARHLTEEQALSCIAGYTIVNDVTDRETQRKAKQWFRGKSADTFCPVGPFLVTPDELGDPQNLAVRSFINGKPLQDGHTSKMIFSVARLLVTITQTITLEPGDLIATGTPAGVGFARKPPIHLKSGDVVEIELDKLGKQTAPVH